MKKIRLIELFAGIGTQAMALRELGADFERYRVVENDRFAIQSYNAIHGTRFRPVDIRDMTGYDLQIVDTDKYLYIMTYSFPCTTISIAGKQAGMAQGSNTASSLLWEVKRLLEECENLPQVLLMENVPQIHSKKFIPYFQEWQDFLVSVGYHNFWQDMNAENYGVPQHRVRTFMVSLLNGGYTFPAPSEPSGCIADIMENDVDEKFYINNEKSKAFLDKLLLVGRLE